MSYKKGIKKAVQIEQYTWSPNFSCSPSWTKTSKWSSSKWSYGSIKGTDKHWYDIRFPVNVELRVGAMVILKVINTRTYVPRWELQTDVQEKSS